MWNAGDVGIEDSKIGVSNLDTENSIYALPPVQLNPLPAFIQERDEIFNKLYAEYQAEVASMSPMGFRSICFQMLR